MAAISKVIFFGFNDITAGAAALAAEVGFETLIVSNTSQANRVTENGQSFNDAVLAAKAESIISDDITTPEVVKALGDMNSSVAISVGAPWIFTKEYIKDVLKGNILNLHGTKLPKDRGGTIYSWLIFMGHRTGMCLLHQLTDKIDRGVIVGYEEFIWSTANRKPADYMKQYATENVAFLGTFFNKIKAEGLEINDAIIPEYLSSYWPRLDARINGWVNWDWSAQEIERFVCAFDDPYAGARTRWNDKVIILKEAYSQATDGYTHPFQRGIVHRKNKNWITISANGGELIVCSVTDIEGNDIKGQIKVGDILYTTNEDLVQTRTRVPKK
ncbi:MAG: hypothetical protein F9K23_13415 [Bacteroidetes bacterium]|nr:MAG: hypothetical protein F9K23_13415 [Bacteroidota bacterium]